MDRLKAELRTCEDAAVAWVVKDRSLLAGETLRLDVVVCGLTGRSRSESRGMLDEGCVTVNQISTDNPGQVVTAGDRVSVRFDVHRRYREKPKERVTPGFRIVHNDPHLIVVEKEARLLTVPTDRAKGGSLVDLVNAELRRQGLRAAHVIHRLDRGVSGLLVFARNSAVAGQLHSALRARQIQREYSAIVTGEMQQETGRFESWLTTDRSLNRHVSREEDDEDGGELAITNYRVERVLSGATLVRVNLETGRRHQIRCHFAEAGHPVLGDDRYRCDLAAHPRWRENRLALHARSLQFRHPVTGEERLWESPLPAEFQRFLGASNS